MADDSRYLTERTEYHRRRTRRVRLAMFFTVALVVLGGGYGVLFRAPLLSVERVTVEGSDTIADRDVLAALELAADNRSWLRALLGSGNMLSWQASLGNELLAVWPRIKNVTIEKDYRDHTVRVLLEERTAYGVWCARRLRPAQCAWFDEEGVLYGGAPEVSGNLIRSVSDYASDALVIGARIPLIPGKSAELHSEYVARLRSIFDVLAASGVSIKDVRFEEPELQEIRVEVSDGPLLLFSLRFAASGTLAVLQSLLHGASGQTKPFPALTTVDFRVENRVYYK